MERMRRRRNGGRICRRERGRGRESERVVEGETGKEIYREREKDIASKGER